MIDLWYGDTQSFGHLGVPQRWVNILGRITAPGQVAALQYTLNGGPPLPLSIGPDRHRLANPGDFNVEINGEDLREGKNTAIITATDRDGRQTDRTVTLQVTRNRVWPLPYTIDWSDATAIQDVAQVVDGRWALQPDGIRVLEPYYDRVIALGDRTWTDYELTADITFHGMRVPDKSVGDGGANVIHAALAVRWPGHDADGRQPRVKWYPLGATAEFRVNLGWENCSWRILGGAGMRVESDAGRPIVPERRYRMKHRVETLPDCGALYCVKLWDAVQAEPDAWDLQIKKAPDDVPAGGALLIAHYTDVTFGTVTAVPV